MIYHLLRYKNVFFPIFIYYITYRTIDLFRLDPFIVFSVLYDPGPTQVFISIFEGPNLGALGNVRICFLFLLI